jgi:lipoate-protein ligase B
MGRMPYAARGIEVFDIERGGDVSYRGPGQLDGYPIYDLTQHRPGSALVSAPARAESYPRARRVGPRRRAEWAAHGVWIEDRKIASIGIHVKQWVTWHGFGLNVTTDLSYFDLIVPCGIPDVLMTSVTRELRERAPRDLWSRAVDATVLGFAEVFQQQPQALAFECVSGKRAEGAPTHSAAYTARPARVQRHARDDQLTARDIAQ